MVYIYKKIVGKKPYYYLRSSVRKGTRVGVKDVAYLGSSVKEVRESLGKLPALKGKIEKAYRTINLFLESNHFLEQVQRAKPKTDIFLGLNLLDVEACRLHYSTVFENADRLTKKEILRDFLIEFAFNSTSIEGNTISLKEARDLLEDGLTPKGKTLREIYDLQNTEKVFNSLDLAKELTNELIQSIHSGLMENIDQRVGYRIRDIIVTRSRFKSSPAYAVKTDMDLLLEWFNKNKGKIHPFVLAVVFHHKFEKIHPFMDGNGRTGRVLANFILMKNNYPPLIIRKKIRADYLDSLSQADNSPITASEPKDYSNIVHLAAEELTKTYWRIFL
ncbi:MAG TPA: Fic family protein [archaeon]|nr:Fic family protein [archaeon]